MAALTSMQLSGVTNAEGCKVGISMKMLDAPYFAAQEVAAQDAHQGGFACAVFTHQSVDLACAQIKIYALQGSDAAEILVDARQPDDLGPSPDRGVRAGLPPPDGLGWLRSEDRFGVVEGIYVVLGVHRRFGIGRHLEPPGRDYAERGLEQGDRRQPQRGVLVLSRGMAKPEEVASVVLFLAGEVASLTTGSMVLAEGGYVCW